MLDLSASLSDVAPVSPMIISVDANKHKIDKAAFVKTVYSMICWEDKPE